MKKLCIQICEKALLTIEVTEEMERDFYDCWNKAEHTKEFKDCQKTAGQRQIKGHISWEELDMTMMSIVIEATALVLSGELDKLK